MFAEGHLACRAMQALFWADADLAGLFGRKVARSGCNSPRARPASQRPYISKRMESVCSFSKAPLGCPQSQVSVRFTANTSAPSPLLYRIIQASDNIESGCSEVFSGFCWHVCAHDHG